MKAHPPELHEEARRLLEAGETYASAAKLLGVSVNTVKRWFIPEQRERNRLASQKYKKTMKKGICVDCGGPTYWSKDKPSIRCQACRAIWVREKQVQKWPREKIIYAIQRWAEEKGRPPRSHEWLFRGEWWPNMTSVYGPTRPFQTWRAAIQAAGYDTPAFTHKNPGPRKRHWSVDEARGLREVGFTDREIGERFGVTGGAIYLALGRREKKQVVKRNRNRDERISDLRRALANQ